MNGLRRVVLVFASGLLAVLGLAVVPSASAQTTTPPLTYTVQTSGADLAHAQDGDPLHITVSGLPADATATFYVCPAQLRDSLLKSQLDPVTKKLVWVPDPSLANRVNAYCGSFNDELSGAPFQTPRSERGRSALTQSVVFDTYVPRGTSAPKNVSFDPEFTTLNPSATIPWPANPDKKQYSYTCDDAHPCTMMLKLTGKPAGATAAQTVYDSSISFTASPPGLKIQGCGGVGAGTVTASMPERFGRTAVAWNQLLCAPTKAAQPANILAETEDTGLTSFDKGDSDVVFTGSGGALAAQDVRARSYVPVALNATVLAAVGWTPTDRSDSGAALVARLASNLRFSWDDVANMLSKGGELPDAGGRGGIFTNGSALVTRNPALAAISGPTSPVQAPDARAGHSDSTFYGVTGESGPGSVPLALSGKLAGLPAWTYGNFRSPQGDPLAGNGKPVGVVSDLNTLNLGDDGVHNVDAKTGRINVRKQVSNTTLGTGIECTNGCLNWVVTDLATATEYGWTPVALPNGKGGYIAPTPATLQAAAAHAKPAKDGSLEITGAADDPNAYPLTFVESMAAPVNPLVDASCAPEKAKQDQLATFLKAATNGGQNGMGPGMVALTPDLLSAAQDAATKVGTGTAASACHEQQEAQNPAADGPGPGASGGPVGGDLGGNGPGSGASATGPAQDAALTMKAPTAASVQAARNLADGVRIPLFPGAGALAALIPLLALVALVLLPSSTGYLTAGKPLPPWVNRFARRLRTLRGRA
ncbi:hypothetical protein [Amycolatopsis saalfeldensis]|uniref:PBP domain-containing protein n=1 Tax=Amycolatopsis saalfeldensis TaxID=394193 RepID=A0A1H8VXX4_9PSEU|nr:hypothetical protein [Amycolatopsis saalfeldensis]SEP20154.1 hypothetical protein SAMN04489732_104376 [Amycolatopsis saalfeldensis]